MATAAAADNPTAATRDVGAAIDAAEAHGQRDAWTEASPGSVLLTPFGGSVAGVADIMDITYDEAADAITLHLDLVHHPDIVTEFLKHPKQTLDPATSHHHFTTPSGVKVDAAGLLQALQQSHYEVPGIHVFLKAACGDAAVTDLTQSPGGGVTTITATLKCGGFCDAVTFTLNGPYKFVSNSPCEKKASTAQAGARLADERLAFAQYSGLDLVASINVIALGAVRVCVTKVNGATVTSIKCLTVGGPAQLVLAPAKAYRHVHEHATVTALALDENNAPLAGAAIMFAVSGDCSPALATASALTDASGRATASISAKKPGAVAVVAAATSATGARLVTLPAHIIFFDNHEYVEHRERE